jgi:hypothetical protein
MERQFDCLSLWGLSLRRFGARNALTGHSGLEIIVAGWYSVDDDAIEVDDPVGWEPLIHYRP